MTYKINFIENDTLIETTDYSKNYWNDKSIEKNKVFNIEDGFEKLDNSKKIQNLFHQLNAQNLRLILIIKKFFLLQVGLVGWRVSGFQNQNLCL